MKLLIFIIMICFLQFYAQGSISALPASQAYEEEYDPDSNVQEEKVPLSMMDALPPGATPGELLKAYQTDYIRAAKLAGIDADHNDLEEQEVENDAMMIPLGGSLQLIMNMSSGQKMVWYAGVPQDMDWMMQEMQLLLLAGDNTLSVEEAKKYAEEIWEEALNNNQKAVNKTLPSGLGYSCSWINQRIISYYIFYM